MKFPIREQEKCDLLIQVTAEWRWLHEQVWLYLQMKTQINSLYNVYYYPAIVSNNLQCYLVMDIIKLFCYFIHVDAPGGSMC